MLYFLVHETPSRIAVLVGTCRVVRYVFFVYIVVCNVTVKWHLLAASMDSVREGGVAASLGQSRRRQPRPLRGLGVRTQGLFSIGLSQFSSDYNPLCIMLHVVSATAYSTHGNEPLSNFTTLLYCCTRPVFVLWPTDG